MSCAYCGIAKAQPSPPVRRSNDALAAGCRSDYVPHLRVCPFAQLLVLCTPTLPLPPRSLRFQTTGKPFKTDLAHFFTFDPVTGKVRSGWRAGGGCRVADRTCCGPLLATLLCSNLWAPPGGMYDKDVPAQCEEPYADQGRSLTRTGEHGLTGNECRAGGQWGSRESPLCSSFAVLCCPFGFVVHTSITLLCPCAMAAWALVAVPAASSPGEHSCPRRTTNNAFQGA